jgi:hypothetical protein
VWTCGRNANGALGLPNISKCSTFTHVDTKAVGLKEKIKQVSCGGYYTILLTHNNELWGCGYNNRNQLDHTNNRSIYNFKRIHTFPFRVKEISANFSTCTVLSESGNVYSTDDTWYGYKKDLNWIGGNPLDLPYKMSHLGSAPSYATVLHTTDNNVLYQGREIGMFHCSYESLFTEQEEKYKSVGNWFLLPPIPLTSNETIQYVSNGSHIMVAVSKLCNIPAIKCIPDYSDMEIVTIEDL